MSPNSKRKQETVVLDKKKKKNQGIWFKVIIA